jgi:hypothetical protein
MCAAGALRRRHIRRWSPGRPRSAHREGPTESLIAPSTELAHEYVERFHIAVSHGSIRPRTPRWSSTSVRPRRGRPVPRLSEGWSPRALRSKSRHTHFVLIFHTYVFGTFHHATAAAADSRATLSDPQSGRPQSTRWADPMFCRA